MPSVLIADDYAPTRSAIRTFLQLRGGLEICGEAVDGVDAVRKAEQLKPDLILLDLRMPQLNGVEAASVLKRRMPHVPIILFTMYDEAVGESLASTIGVDLVLSKTNGLLKLADCAQTLLTKRNWYLSIP